MKTSCIRSPESTRYIQLHEWQVRFCQNNHCAALLLSYFTAWHDWKVRNDQYYRRSNDIAELHGDGRPNNENAYLFFTTEELVDGCMGLYGKKAVTDGLELLVSLGVISVHQNPNPRYKFDKTKYFQFYPQVCNRWIAENYPVDGVDQRNDSQVIDYSDSTKMDDRENKNALPSGETERPSRKNSQAITDTTNNTTNINQSINARDDFKNDENKSELIDTLIEALVEKGMPRSKFYPDTLKAIRKLVAAGSTLNQFLTGYDIAVKYTKGNGFGVNYLLKVVESLVVKAKEGHAAGEQGGSVETDSAVGDVEYRSDFRNAAKWAGDLL